MSWGFFGGAPPGVRRANFHYNTPPAICQAKSCTNIKKIKIPILCILPIAFCGWMWYNLQCQEGKAPDELSRPRWDTKPKSRCVATMPILCRKPPVEKKLRFFSTTLLTNHPSCDTIRVSRGEGSKPHTPRHWQECDKANRKDFSKKFEKPLDKPLKV